MDRKFVEEWLGRLKDYWFNKDIENAVSLFKQTTYYQETPFMEQLSYSLRTTTLSF